MWPHVAEEQAHHRPLQVRPVHRAHTHSHTGSGCLTTPMAARVQSARTQMFLTGLGSVQIFLGSLETSSGMEEPLYEPGINTCFQSATAGLRVFMFPRVPSATAPPVQGSSVPCGTLWTTLRRRRWWMFSKWSRLYVRRDSACSPVW